jgi:hypothetical protein
VGTRIALDAQLLINRTGRRPAGKEGARSETRDVRDALAGAPAEFDAMAAMAVANLGHALLGLERAFERVRRTRPGSSAGARAAAGHSRPPRTRH